VKKTVTIVVTYPIKYLTPKRHHEIIPITHKRQTLKDIEKRTEDRSHAEETMMII